MSLVSVGAVVVLSTLAGVIALGVVHAEPVDTATSAQAAVTPSAQEVIDEFFRARLGANGKQGDAAVAPRISAALAALWKEHDRLCDELHEGPCRLDEMYDVWLGTQEYGEGLTFESSGYVSTALSDNRVHVSFDLFPLDMTQKTKGRYERKSIFHMIQEDGHWVVDDMDRVGANTIRQYIEKDTADIALVLAKREMEALQPLKRKMIDAFYRQQLNSWSSPGRSDDPMMSASLEVLVSENKRLCAELNDGICGWERGAVPWVSAQDVGDGLTFDTAGYLSYDMPDDHVRVRFNICPLELDPQRRVNCERTYEFAMILENGKWVVNDFFRPDDLSARKTLEADNKKMDENLKAAGPMPSAPDAGEKY